MGDVGDGIAALTWVGGVNGADKLNKNQSTDEILGLDGDGDGKQHDFLVGVENAESHENAQHSSRCTLSTGERRNAADAGVGHGDSRKRCADDAEKIKLGEFLPTPVHL